MGTRFASLPALHLVFSVLSTAAQMEGVLHSIQQGEGRNPAGTIHLSSSGRVFSFEIAPRQLNLTRACYEIGSIWSIEYGRLDDFAYVKRVRCGERRDATVHGAWLAARDQLFRSTTTDQQLFMRGGGCLQVVRANGSSVVFDARLCLAGKPLRMETAKDPATGKHAVKREWVASREEAESFWKHMPGPPPK